MNRQGQVRTRSHVQRKASTTPPIQKSFFWERPFTNSQHGNPDLPQQEPTQTSRASVPALSRAKIDIDRPIPIQPKLTVGAPNDQYEQEADRVAAQVMSTPDAAVQQPIQREAQPDKEELQTKPLAASITPLVQREMMPEEEEPVQAKLDSIQREEMPEEEEVQTKPIDISSVNGASLQQKCSECEQEKVQRSGNGTAEAGSDIESRLSSSKGGGSPLSDEVRSFMEPRFGADFSQVRTHTGGAAVQMSQAIGAQAFTHGSDIYFGAGKSPTNSDLTAHELTHVVQQTGVVQRSINVSPVSELVQRREVCDENNVCWSEEGEDASYYEPSQEADTTASDTESQSDTGAGGAPAETPYRQTGELSNDPPLKKTKSFSQYFAKCMSASTGIPLLELAISSGAAWRSIKAVEAAVAKFGTKVTIGEIVGAGFLGEAFLALEAVTGSFYLGCCVGCLTAAAAEKATD